MFKKIIGRVCKNPDCELKDKVKEDYIVMCDCGQPLQDVSVIDRKKVAILGIIVLLLLGSGTYMAAMKIKQHFIGKVTDAANKVVAPLVGEAGKMAPPNDSATPPAVPATTSPAVPAVTDPKASMTLVSDGLKLAKENNMQGALEKFKLAAEKDPANAQAYGNLGAAYLAVGKHADALDASLKATQLEPTNPIWHLNAAELYSMKSDKGNALNELEAAVANGFNDIGKFKTFDFKNIEKEPKYKELVRRMK